MKAYAGRASVYRAQCCQPFLVRCTSEQVHARSSIAVAAAPSVTTSSPCGVGPLPAKREKPRQLVSQAPARPTSADPAADKTTAPAFPRADALALSTLAAVGLSLLLPEASHSTETLSGGALSAFKDFLDYVETLGPAGPVVFVLTVMLFEMVPLFPTQPLSMAGGLLFGPIQGAAAVLVGMTLAALNAFLISRGVGRKLAEKVIVMEMNDDHGPVQAKLVEVQHIIRSGGVWQQLSAITLLRLTPVVPFSASNYVLGLTPVHLPAYIGGTAIGMSVWSILYASLGGASRQLLDGGMDIGDLFTDLADKASSYSSVALGVTAVVAVLGAAAVVLRGSMQQQEPLQQGSTLAVKDAVTDGSLGGGASSSSSSSSGGAGSGTRSRDDDTVFQKVHETAMKK